MFVEVRNMSQRPFKTAKPGDVGYDLYAVVDQMNLLESIVAAFIGKRCYILWPLAGTKNVSSKIWLSMPSTIWCRIVARSSTKKRKIQCLGGEIDSQYQGELFAILHNFGLLPRLIIEGERYVQVVFHHAVRPSMKGVLAFSYATERGTSGFGSTGS